jgi:hypothetical protein
MKGVVRTMLAASKPSAGSACGKVKPSPSDSAGTLSGSGYALSGSRSVHFFPP